MAIIAIVIGYIGYVAGYCGCSNSIIWLFCFIGGLATTTINCIINWNTDIIIGCIIVITSIGLIIGCIGYKIDTIDQDILYNSCIGCNIGGICFISLTVTTCIATIIVAAVIIYAIIRWIVILLDCCTGI